MTVVEQREREGEREAKHSERKSRGGGKTSVPRASHPENSSSEKEGASPSVLVLLPEFRSSPTVEDLLLPLLGAQLASRTAVSPQSQLIIRAIREGRRSARRKIKPQINVTDFGFPSPR